MQARSATALLSLSCLLIAAASIGQASRVSGRDTPGPSRLGAACPKHPLSPRRLAHLNRNPGAKTATVPGEPDRLLLCRYSGLYRSRDLPRLSAQRRIGPVTTRELAEQFNRQPPYPNGARSCPTGNGGPIYALFRYRSQPAVVVEAWRDGCDRLWNGHAPARALMTPLEKRLLRMVPLPASSSD
jgi:hypothetical protein